MSSSATAWPYWPLLPLYPYGHRPTLRQEVMKDRIWTFDQPHGILYAIVPIRMTIVRLETGGLLVYAPIAPTPECLALIRELTDRYGSIRYIVLPTSSGLEHKVFVPAFARQFPRAQLWTTPHQWSFPLNLPLGWLGFPTDRTQELSESVPPAFGFEFDHALIHIPLGAGTFAESVLFHRPTRTLLVTDVIVAFPPTPPPIVCHDPYGLLFHARDCATDIIEDTPTNRQKGWKRMALFAAYFRPDAVQALSLAKTLQMSLRAPDRSAKAYFGLYPFQWRADWENTFDALHNQGKPLVAPILQQLILPQAPDRVNIWLDRISQWDFTQIIPCHLAAPIAATAADVSRAFRFMTEGVPTLPLADTAFVRELEAFLVTRGIAKKVA